MLVSLALIWRPEKTFVLCEIRIHTLQYHAYPHRIQMHIATKILCKVSCTQDHQRRRRIRRTGRWRGVMRKGSAIAAVPGEPSSLLWQKLFRRWISKGTLKGLHTVGMWGGYRRCWSAELLSMAMEALDTLLCTMPLAMVISKLAVFSFRSVILVLLLLTLLRSHSAPFLLLFVRRRIDRSPPIFLSLCLEDRSHSEPLIDRTQQLLFFSFFGGWWIALRGGFFLFFSFSLWGGG